MGKNMQISEDMFVSVYNLVFRLKEYDLDKDTTQIVNELETQLNAKLEAMNKRDAYSKYKGAATPEEKEKARKEYVEMAGIRKDYLY